jgi:hypothetical protein
MPKINDLKLPKVLIVEGNHERDFFTAFFAHLGRTDVQILPIGGKTLLSDNLLMLAKDADFPLVSTLVIARDADDQPGQAGNHGGAFTSVVTALTRAGLPTPAKPWDWHNAPNPQSATVPPQQMRLAVLILPDAVTQGALEELLVQTVATDVMYPDSEALVAKALATLPAPAAQNAPPVARAHPPAHKRGKARVHAFLSTFESPDLDQGKAALRGVWDFNHASLQPLRAILQAM